MKLLRLLVVPVVLLMVFVYGPALGGLYGALGYALLAWVLIRAAPGCVADVRGLFGFASGLASRDRSNTGF